MFFSCSAEAPSFRRIYFKVESSQAQMKSVSVINLFILATVPIIHCLPALENGTESHIIKKRSPSFFSFIADLAKFFMVKDPVSTLTYPGGENFRVENSFLFISPMNNVAGTKW